MNFHSTRVKIICSRLKIAYLLIFTVPMYLLLRPSRASWALMPSKRTSTCMTISFMTPRTKKNLLRIWMSATTLMYLLHIKALHHEPFSQIPTVTMQECLSQCLLPAVWPTVQFVSPDAVPCFCNTSANNIRSPNSRYCSPKRFPFPRKKRRNPMMSFCGALNRSILGTILPHFLLPDLVHVQIFGYCLSPECRSPFFKEAL